MRKQIFLLLTLLSIVVGCQPSPVTPPTPTPQPGDSAEMVLVCYFMGESNLRPDLMNNITQMETAVAEEALGDKGRILVFMDTNQGGCIYELVNVGGGVCERRKVKNYQSIDCADPEVLCDIMRDVKELAPSNHYGFVFGGHGNGWVVEGLSMKDLNVYGSDWTKGRYSSEGVATIEHEGFWDKYNNPQDDWRTRALGYDVSRWMDIPEFARGLEVLQPDFVLFDACSMASVEALWDLRNVTRYVISSSSEIMRKGFPYTPIIKYLFEDWDDLERVCVEYVNHYQSDANEPYATLSLVDVARLEEVGEAVNKVLATARDVDKSWLSNVDSLQYYEGLANHVFYDLSDCMTRLATDVEALAEFDEAMERAVVWEGHTAQGYSDYSRGEYPIKRSSGLTVYISRTKFTNFATAYSQTSWAQNVGMIQYVNQ